MCELDFHSCQLSHAAEEWGRMEQKLLISKFVLTAIIFLSCIPTFAQTTRTYYLKIRGDLKTGKRLVAELSNPDCHTIDGIAGCHAFRKFENENQILGRFPEVGSSYLYKVSIDSPRKFNLQIFERDGKNLRRILNAGDFRPQGDFYLNLVRTTKTLTFK